MYMQTARSTVHGQGTLDRVEDIDHGRTKVVDALNGMVLWIGVSPTNEGMRVYVRSSRGGGEGGLMAVIEFHYLVMLFIRWCMSKPPS